MIDLSVSLGGLVKRSPESEAFYRQQSIQTALDKRQWAVATELAREAVWYGDDVHRLLAVALSHQGMHEDALKEVRQAIETAPHDAKCHTALGTVLFHLGDATSALRAFEAGYQLDPGFAEAAANLAAMRLMQGHFAEAWPLFLARFSMNVPSPVPSSPLGTAQIGKYEATTEPAVWDGKPYPGKTLLVWGEQGIGDQILFSNMLCDLSTLPMAVAVVCERRLLPLFTRSFPKIVFVAAGSVAMPKYDYQILIGELGRFYRQSVDKFPQRPNGWLKASPAKGAAFKARFIGHQSRAVVGISWRSDRLDDGAEKSVPPTLLKPILGVNVVRWLNLQHGAFLSTDIFPERDGAVDPETDLDGLAAQLKGINLFITASNSTAHLAAALGVETWLMAPLGKGARWYWGTSETPSPWYQNLRVFRQTTPGQWAPVMADVKAALEGRILTHGW